MVKYTKIAVLITLMAASMVALSACGSSADRMEGHLTEERRDYYIDFFKGRDIVLKAEGVEAVVEPEPEPAPEPVYIIERDPYFKESDLTLLDAGHNTIDSEVYLYDSYHETTGPSEWTIEHWGESDSLREGYKILEVKAFCVFPREDYSSCYVSFDTYDYYLGVRFPNSLISGDGHAEYSTVMLDNYSEYTDSAVDNNAIVECDINYSKNAKWEMLSDGQRRANLDLWYEMPDYYDGIVLAFIPASKTVMEGHFSGYYAFDSDLYVPGTKFVRIGTGENW